jgi:hypothetical protein
MIHHLVLVSSIVVSKSRSQTDDEDEDSTEEGIAARNFPSSFLLVYQCPSPQAIGRVPGQDAAYLCLLLLSVCVDAGFCNHANTGTLVQRALSFATLNGNTRAASTTISIATVTILPPSSRRFR